MVAWGIVPRGLAALSPVSLSIKSFGMAPLDEGGEMGTPLDSSEEEGSTSVRDEGNKGVDRDWRTPRAFKRVVLFILPLTESSYI